MKNFRPVLTMACAMVVVACFQTSLSAQTESKPRTAVASSSGLNVTWDVGGVSSGVIVVSGPDGRVFQKEFKAGTLPEFFATDKNGERLPDGQYSYELRFTNTALASGASAPKRPSDDEPEADRAGHKRAPIDNVQSGTFAIVNGSVIVAGAVEGRGVTKLSEPPRALAPVSGNTITRLRNHRISLLARPDVVTADDEIIQGSLCVGLDCVNNESFGFDTIRLKENNTRIKFDDTSTAAGFPNNDWQLTANDSASGGANKFSIEDITGAKIPFTITAGAPTNSMFIDSIGRLGLHTSVPSLDVHLLTGNTPAIRLDQDRTQGFTPQIWDVAGNEANFFVRDVTGGSRLPLRIRPGAPTSSVDIAASGNVGVGTASPSQALHVRRDQNTNTIVLLQNGTGGTGAQADFRVVNDVGTPGQFGIFSSATSAYGMVNPGDVHVYSGSSLGLMSDNAAGIIKFATGGNTEKMRLTANGRLGIGTPVPDQLLSVNGDASKTNGGGSWQVFSDERLKNIKGDFSRGLNAVMRLRPLRYEYKPDNALGLKSEGEHIGFRAQALQQVIPEAVTKNAEGYLMVNNDPIIWTMLNAIKEQQKQIADLKVEVQKLRASSRRLRK